MGRLIAFVLAACISMVGCNDRGYDAAKKQLSFEERAAQTIAERKRVWASKSSEIKANAEAALAAGKLDEVRALVNAHMQAAGTELDDLRTRLESAEASKKKAVDREETLQALARQKDNPMMRRSLLAHMEQLEPTNPKWKSEWRVNEQKLTALAVAISQKEAARKRREGVTIGMSQADVLASNWGRPQSRNVSTYSFGTHEQWVYGGGQYLYFENGILKSMQTSR